MRLSPFAPVDGDTMFAVDENDRGLLCEEAVECLEDCFGFDRASGSAKLVQAFSRTILSSFIIKQVPAYVLRISVKKELANEFRKNVSKEIKQKKKCNVLKCLALVHVCTPEISTTSDVGAYGRLKEKAGRKAHETNAQKAKSFCTV